MTTKEEKKRAINRLKTMYPLRAQIDEAYKRNAEAIKEGKPTAWSMANFWEADPISKAMGVEVIYPENYGAVLGASGIADRYLDLSDSEGFPSYLCGYSRASFGYTCRMMRETEGEVPPEAPMGGMPKPLFLTSQGTPCDASVQWFQALGRYMDVPVWMMESPNPGVEEIFMEGAYERAVKFVKSELQAFIEFQERLLGKKMDWDKYAEMVDDTIEICRIAYETFELRKAKPCPMHSRDFWSTVPVYYLSLGDTKKALKLYQDMYDEVKYRVDNGIGAVEPEKYRLAFADLPPWHSLSFFDRLAEKGWNFVVETHTYRPPIPLEGIEKISDPLERHARFHLQFMIGYYKMALEDNEYFGFIGYPYLVYVRDFKCDGMFLHPLITCRSMSTHHPYVRDLIMRKVKVPSITVEGDIVDLRLFDPEDALRKAEAFEETMEHYKKVRKGEGFDW
ncbi:2-hydroxyacyl-CoA dehydratase [Chloroflexota bacterium]